MDPFPLTLITNDFTLVVPPEATTLEGFRKWATHDDFPEGVSVTYLQGEIILDVSNEELNAHVAVKTETTGVLSQLVKAKKLGKFSTSGVLLTNVSAGIANNPDSLFLSKDTLESARAKFVPRKGAEHLYRELEGVPDWVLEVVSDSSVTKDRTRLREAYHRAGIAEYWLLDARGDDVNLQILQHRKTRYVAAPRKDGWAWSKVFARWFLLERTRGRRDLWRYRLNAREA